METTNHKINGIRARNKFRHEAQANYYTSLLSAPRIHRSHKIVVAHAWAHEMRAMLQQVD